MFKAFLLATFIVSGSVAQNAPLLDILREEMDRNYGVLKGQSRSRSVFYPVRRGRAERPNRIGASLGPLWSAETRVHGADSRCQRQGGRSEAGRLSRVRGVRGCSSRRRPVCRWRIGRTKSGVGCGWKPIARGGEPHGGLINLKTSTQVNVAATDDSDDFSKEEPSTFVGPVPTLKRTANVDWAERVRGWSSIFSKYPGILFSGIGMQLTTETKYLVNSEGTRGCSIGRGFTRMTRSRREAKPRTEWIC